MQVILRITYEPFSVIKFKDNSPNKKPNKKLVLFLLKIVNGGVPFSNLFLILILLILYDILIGDKKVGWIRYFAIGMNANFAQVSLKVTLG